MRDQDEHGENRADHEERRPQAQQAEDRRRDERTDRHRAHREAPRHAEHASQHVVRNRALEEREPGDVDDAVRRADRREQNEHGHGIGKRRDQHDRDAPEDEGPGEGRSEPLAAQRDRAERTDQASGSDRGRQVSDARRALVEHLVCGDDDQHVQASAHERLCGDETDEEPRAGNLADCPEALPDIDSRRTRGRMDATRHRDTHDEGGRHEERCRAGREDHRDVGKCDQHPGCERTEERAEALDRRGRSVRRDQLRRRSRQRWQQRDESRPEQRRADTDRRPGGEDDDAIVHRGPRGRDHECRRSQEHDSQQEPLAPEAVAQGRCERRDGGRREQAHETGDPDRRRPAVVVREHTECDEVRPLGTHARAPGQLGAANVGVSSRHAKGGERLDGDETRGESTLRRDSGGPRISDARSTRYACRPLIAEEPSCPAVVQSRAPS